MSGDRGREEEKGLRVGREEAREAADTRRMGWSREEAKGNGEEKACAGVRSERRIRALRPRVGTERCRRGREREAKARGRAARSWTEEESRDREERESGIRERAEGVRARARQEREGKSRARVKSGMRGR